MNFKRLFKYLSRGFLGILLLILVLVMLLAAYAAVLYCRADYREPDFELAKSDYALSVDTDSLKICGEHHLLLNEQGLWEEYVSGSPRERGAAMGAMGRDLLYFQEKVFVDQIRNLIPSDSYLKFLRALIEIFNRNMAENIPEEYLDEIYAMSVFCTHEYDVFGNPYERQLNYHAAHDIGHALQEYMLVACSAFGVWDASSSDSTMIVGRNFDFYVGDDFARNKIVLFVEPDQGYRYASVTWPGMVGVVSGMNEKGLCVTINASKGPQPLSSAMPISLLVRHVLQYAQNVDEACMIASRFNTFVSESIMVGSARDNRVVVIEKTPRQQEIYESGSHRIICTNHYQSEPFSRDEYNRENIASSDSKARYERIVELMDEKEPIDLDDAVCILRDRLGKNGKDIGLCNEQSVNQSIAHHSVIFKPGELKMWVSTFPWQAGEFLCYDLKEVFGIGAERSMREEEARGIRSFADKELGLPADSLFLRNDYLSIRNYRELSTFVHNEMKSSRPLDRSMIERFIQVNPNFFETYETAGDYMLSRGEVDPALKYWRRALELEIPRQSYRDRITGKIKRYDKK